MLILDKDPHNSRDSIYDTVKMLLDHWKIIIGKIIYSSINGAMIISYLHGKNRNQTPTSHYVHISISLR